MRVSRVTDAQSQLAVQISDVRLFVREQEGLDPLPGRLALIEKIRGWLDNAANELESVEP